MQCYTTPAPTHSPTLAAPPAQSHDQHLSNSAVVEDLGVLSGCESEAGCLDPDLEAELDDHLLSHSDTAAGLAQVMAFVPVAMLGRANALTQVANVLALGLRADIETLRTCDPDEGGALVDIVRADAGDLVEILLLMDATRWMGEEAQRMGMLAACPALIALFGAPLMMVPSLEALYKTLEAVSAARAKVASAAQDLGEVFAQFAIQHGVDVLLAATGPVAPPLAIGKVFFDNWIDGALGTDPKAMSAQLISGADNFTDQLTTANEVGKWISKGETVLLDDNLLANAGKALDVLDAGVEGLVATTDLLDGLGALVDLAPEVLLARVKVVEARAAIAPAMAVVDLAIADEIWVCAHAMADAATLVQDTEAEVGGRW